MTFSFPFYGEPWSSVWVNSNGNLTFGSGDSDFSETVNELLNDQPRIAPLWDDLSPNQGGEVEAEWGNGSLTIRWIGVPQFLAGDSNNFSVTLHSSGEIDIDYGNVDAVDGISGTSAGGGVANPGSSNLSSASSWMQSGGAVYELFNSLNPFDLDNLLITFN